MKLGIEEKLCTRCGLCCDGSLFADVELANSREAVPLEAMGLQIEDADDGEAPVLRQPCAALKSNRCTVYQFRPGCCRTFECRLLRQVKTGSIGIREAEEKIADAVRQVQFLNKLLRRFEFEEECRSLKERYQETLSRGVKLVELEREVLIFEQMVEKVFL